MSKQEVRQETSKEVTQEEFRAVVTGASLLGINLSEFYCKLNAVPGDDYSLVLENKAARVGSKGLNCKVSMSLRCEMGEGDDAQLISQFKAAYEVFYHLANEDDCTDAAIRLFVERNATYNVFPYFRELVDGHTRRMGIGTLALPLLKPQNSGTGTLRFTPVKPTEVTA